MGAFEGKGPLSGFKIIELAGIGPGPFCGMMLADMGAEVIRVERISAAQATQAPKDVLTRNRRSIAVDLKSPAGVEAILRLVEKADGLIEGFRPGVTERLGLGPKDCQDKNPRLVYGRMTGWGQEGPMAQAAGHDINYISLAGALHAIGRNGERPVPPLNLVGDFGGGGMLLAYGMVCGLLEATKSNRGQVIDAAMIDGTAALMAMFYSMSASGVFDTERGTNMLDGGAHFHSDFVARQGRFPVGCECAGRDLIFDQHRGGAHPPICPNRTLGVHRIAVAVIAVGQDQQVGGGGTCHVQRVLHLGRRQ